MEIISRNDALRLGQTHYFTGNPCKRGHVARRLVSDWACTVCKYESGRQRQMDNPALQRGYGEKYRARHTEKERARQRASKQRQYETDRDIILARNRDWGRRNAATKIARNQRRRARLNQSENTLTFAEWTHLVSVSPHCHWCKKRFSARRRPTHDHIIPIIKGGGNTLENSCCACLQCNVRKRASLVNPANGQGILV